jgi:branched-chain amino acid transport system ATP-binding protein
MLTLNNIEVRYRGLILVLKGVSLNVPDQAIVALLGANGAGKTTTLKAISGMLSTEEGQVSRGNIAWDGGRIENSESQYVAQLGIIQVMEGRRVLEHLTVEENLRVAAHIRGRGFNMNKELDRIFGYFPKLRDLRHCTSGYLSGGEQQMLVLGRGLIAAPKLMLLDEPSLGLAPLVAEEIYNIMRRIHFEEKLSMLLVEQNAKAALSIANHGYVMENGRIVFDGASEQLMQNEDIREFYLGLSEVGQRKSYKEIKHYRRRKRWLG